MLATIWHTLHAISRRHELAFQVGFPGWQDPVKTPTGDILRPGSFGPVVQVFAQPAALDVFVQELNAQRLVSRGLVVLGPCLPVPANVSETAAFVRIHTLDRATDSQRQRQLRREQRLAERGIFLPKLSDQEVIAKRQRAALATKSVFIRLRSSTNQQRYRLAVERRVQPKDSNGCTSYGLMGTVPQF